MLTVGIIGTGVGVRTHLKGFRGLEGVYVKGVSGSTDIRAQAIAKEHDVLIGYSSYEDVCDDPEIDLVCVTSPNRYHLEHTLRALKSGKHVLCEKPLGMSVEDCQMMVDAASSNPGLISLVNHQLRFNPYMKKIRDLVQSGEIGTPYLCRIHQQGTAFSNRQMPWCWSFDGEEGGGVRLAMGSHLIDLLSYIFNASVSSVMCSMSAVVGERFDASGEIHKVTGSGFVGVRAYLEDGVSADLTATAAAYGKSKFDISIYGDLGEIQFDLESKLRLSNKDNLGSEGYVNVPGVYDDEMKNRVSVFSGSFRYLAKDLRDALQNNKRSILASACDFPQAMRLQNVLDACLESYRTGSNVRLSETNEPWVNNDLV